MMDKWMFDESATTDPAHGKAPSERSVEELLAGGIILLDKPFGPTSHQVSAWARDLLGLDKMGHGGTLDPFATGVLPLLAGKAMRMTKSLLTHQKTYIAVLKFSNAVDEDTLVEIMKRLRGRIYNVPPTVSAVKVQVRSRTIHQFELIDIKDNLAVVKIDCDAGTYVRTMARDLGLFIGEEVELTELRRTRSGNYVEQQNLSLSQIADAVWLWKEKQDDSAMRKIIHPLEVMTASMPEIVVKDAAISALAHGAPLARPGIVSASKGVTKGSDVRLMSLKGELIAVAEMIVDSDQLTVMKKGEVAKSVTVIMMPDVYPKGWTSPPPHESASAEVVSPAVEVDSQETIENPITLPSLSELGKMKKAELVELCDNAGLETKGTKAVLIERLTQ
ncbi:MAG: RNA-guided pseudouridylation complex pseudouridine synthase subunit Cbf5 [Euryarchaeota archaeon]|jgi:H/ACA ribonucleoprotein complex subunit 4|nr:RNA-guided pseudouridylation complex pseudouridine synthase subunit Cbf5 [Euryarchaeota archaeon]MBT3970928.1 RNA-guided pseudouridylation complex pseudouridine synthase subunit Cbf5 [Euryarchaeota archaeon]MBT4406525.1 RNA-guided pseudouridylation complex pseudouridine synthase subunit Cbf5 [Euryarchaeota archaeon]MBT6644629.1 RNA-guided pseudouridylation complex pseudouridine synthase subunit Cbf5 [Euryarchaeota archaeon]